MAKNRLPAADVTEDPHYHDTWTLLRKYRDVVWSLEVSVRQVRNRFRIDYGKTIEDFLESVYLAGADLSGTELEHQAKCIEQSHNMLCLRQRRGSHARQAQERRGILLAALLRLSLPAGASERRGDHRPAPPAYPRHQHPDVLPETERGRRGTQLGVVGIYGAG